ncbi:MAG: YbhB/YbcL family Raf kinase inhibitor-like protein [Methanoregula sp.]
MSRNAYYAPGSCPVMHNNRVILSAVILLVFLISGGCTSITPPPAGTVTPSPVQPAYQAPSSVSSGAFTITVDSLAAGSVLPGDYTCKGASESPEVAWYGIPSGTKSLVLILDDPDAPDGRFTHWIVYNIPPVPGELERAQLNVKVLANGAQQGDTSAGSRGYYPPCPPIGTTHRYVFRLYAVDMDITQPTADRDSIDWALTGHTIAETKFTTTFRR